MAAAVLIVFICGILAACGSGKTQSSEGTTAQPAKEADSSQAGNIREKVLFRSASPCNNKHNRAPYVNDLAEKAGVNYILDLADDEDSVEGYIASEDFNSPYFLELYKKGNIHLFDLSMNYVSDDFKERLAEGLTVMADKEGPYLSHCTEGKDRTGFFCILVEALCGADYKEIEEDYMLTYDNYYGINKQSDPERYNTLKELNMDAMLKEIVSDENIDITSADLSGYAKDYMVRIGVKEETVEKLKDVLQ